jgi:hypothetical protein
LHRSPLITPQPLRMPIRLARRRRSLMPDRKHDPHADNDLIDIPDDERTPSQGGTSGGRMEREIGARDEEKTATGADPQPTSVKKGSHPKGGDEPNLPNRGQTRDPQSKAPPRRT